VKALLGQNVEMFGGVSVEELVGGKSWILRLSGEGGRLGTTMGRKKKMGGMISLGDKVKALVALMSGDGREVSVTEIVRRHSWVLWSEELCGREEGKRKNKTMGSRVQAIEFGAANSVDVGYDFFLGEKMVVVVVVDI
jgi:hypothetical protein